ncbi:MAG: ABC transporter substrate-binding protein [Deltaproteobacteria bacterium]|nr:ABC transporter substrate-binding protein [Deltaproteobacteria bacterium]MBI2181803.1 ABC transporter substrate-binding protein [Deltaproteobacteria bacterium]MBI2228519.1 ABC transporter substrate-binding protein [Deltaproteobacteria bacterium]MBI2363575.1 ABC transporter substrate-binding protein [Deltaproteobacteria bacterium]MBI2534684.1 ABC transporter substrate-binding protein [Deltaproteobacteria bacterium]
MNQTRIIPALLLIAMFIGSRAEAQLRAAPEKLRIAYSAIGSSQSPLWVAHEGGIFKKHGLEVDLLYVGGGSRAAQVILSGEVPVAMFNGAAVISADLAGADLVNLASGMNVLPFFLVVGSGTKQIEDLKGKKVAITRFASATDFALRMAAEKWPVKPDKDFTVLQLGGQPEMMAALKSGAIQGAMLNAEFTILARRDGHRDLADVAALGLAFPGSGLNTSRAFIRNRRDTVLRVMRAYTDAVHYGRTQKSFAVGVLGKYLKNQDVPFLEAVHDLYFNRYIPRIPYPSVEAMKTALDDIAVRDPRARGARAEQFIDASLMQELEKEGFLKQLSK